MWDGKWNSIHMYVYKYQLYENVFEYFQRARMTCFKNKKLAGALALERLHGECG